MAERRSMMDVLASVAVGIAAFAAARPIPPPLQPVAEAPQDGEEELQPGLVGFAKAVMAGFGRHRSSRMAAALAYYAIFSLAPMLILAFWVTGLVYSDDAARTTLFEQVETLAGSGIAETIQQLVAARSSGGGSGTFANILGFVFLFVGASGLFLQLRSSLNTIWEVPFEEVKGLLNTLRARLAGFGAVVLLAGGLLVFTVGSSLVAFFAEEIGDALPGLGGLIQVVNPLVGIGGAVTILAVMFRMLPAATVTWRTAFAGGAATGALIGLGAVVVGVLFSFSDPGASFGDFAPIIVLLVFIYYSAQAYLLGAEVTAELGRRRGLTQPV